MTAALYGAAVLLLFSLMLASYLVQMYGEALSLRKRRDKGAFKHFTTAIQPRLGCGPEEGRARYTVAQFLSLGLLSMDLLYLSEQRAAIGIALAEALAMVLVALVAGAQVVPTMLALRTRGRWVGHFVWAGRLLGWCALPVVLLGDFAASIAALGGAPRGAQAQRPSEEIDALLDVGQKEGLIDGEDRKLIHSVVGFGDKTVREVMTPRPRIVAIGADRSLAELQMLIRESDLSRIPVCAESIDDVVGFALGRDTLEFSKEELAAKQTRSVMRPIRLVPETKRISDLMREMQQNRAQIAMVIDEYGQTAGVVTMEDMMEEIVGEIEDETDLANGVVRRSDNSFIALGGTDLDLLEDLVGYRPDEEFESTTIGGLVCEQLGQVPAAGAKVRLHEIEVEVLAADERRVERVLVRRRAVPAVVRGTAG